MELDGWVEKYNPTPIKSGPANSVAREIPGHSENRLKSPILYAAAMEKKYSAIPEKTYPTAIKLQSPAVGVNTTLATFDAKLPTGFILN
jgi:hypothetical protein